MSVSVEAVAREYVKELNLEGQLTVSVFLLRLKLAAAEDERAHAEVRRLGVVDRERGWELLTEE